MAVDRLTGCSAIIVPRRIAHATRTQCLSTPVLFLGLRANILSLSTNGGNCPHRTVKERDGTSEQGFASAKAPIERPVKRSVAALLTGSSRQRPNGFIGRTQPRVGLDGAPICYSAPDICSSLPWWQFPPAERSGMRNWGLFGLNSGRRLIPLTQRGNLAACLCPASNVPAADGPPTKVECRHNEPTPQFG
jgi:hypothetical protein